MERGKTTLGAELQSLALTYSHLFLRAADAFLIWDQQGIIRNANGAACLLTEYERSELVGLDHRTLFPFELRDRLGELLAKSGKKEDGSILFDEDESEIRSKSGLQIPVTLRFIAVNHPEQFSILGIIHDIRDLKNLEARLAASQARYRGIVEHVNEVIVLLDHDGKMLFINEAGEKALGKERADLISTDFSKIVRIEDRPLVRKILNGKFISLQSTKEQLTLRMPTADGSEKEFAVYLSPLPDYRDQPGGILAILHDITGLREIQEKLQYADRLRSVEDILSKITHEVKNPLAAINASAEFLRRHWEIDEESRREVVDLIADETNRINRIITQYLKIRRIPKPTLLNENIEETVKHVEKSLARLLKEKPGIELITDVEAKRFAFDADLVKQILWNLINNAIDAVGEEGEVKVIGKSLEAESEYTLLVTDDGCGMDSDEIRRAFDPFFTSKESGTGLGLAIVKIHVEAMSGSIHVESEKGKGTTVSLSLPLSAKEGI